MPVIVSAASGTSPVERAGDRVGDLLRLAVLELAHEPQHDLTQRRRLDGEVHAVLAQDEFEFSVALAGGQRRKGERRQRDVTRLATHHSDRGGPGRRHRLGEVAVGRDRDGNAVGQSNESRNLLGLVAADLRHTDKAGDEARRGGGKPVAKQGRCRLRNRIGEVRLAADERRRLHSLSASPPELDEAEQQRDQDADYPQSPHALACPRTHPAESMEVGYKTFDRKAFVRGSAGAASMARGAPRSTTTPSSMKTSWSPTSRAKPISWVTTTMVMPSSRQLLHGVEDLADEFGIQGAGGLVEQHQLGVHGQGAGDGDALLLPAAELRRVGRGLVSQPDRGRAVRGHARRPRPATRRGRAPVRW